MEQNHWIQRRDQIDMIKREIGLKIISCGVYQVNRVQKERFQLEEHINMTFYKLIRYADLVKNLDPSEETLVAMAMSLLLPVSSPDKRGGFIIVGHKTFGVAEKGPRILVRLGPPNRLSRP